MSPALSWARFLVCVAVGMAVYLVVAGGRRYRRMIEMPQRWAPQCDHESQYVDGHWRCLRCGAHGCVDPCDAHVRVIGGIYDHEARGDFDGRWTFDHDPLTDHECEVCNARLRRAFNRLAGLRGSPRDADELMAAIREELEP